MNTKNERGEERRGEERRGEERRGRREEVVRGGEKRGKERKGGKEERRKGRGGEDGVPGSPFKHSISNPVSSPTIMYLFSSCNLY